MKGHLNCSNIVTQAKENSRKRQESKIEDIHDLTSAIILTAMAAKADKLSLDIDKLGQNMVIKDGLENYFRSDFCVYLT